MDIISQHEFNKVCDQSKIIKYGRVNQPKVLDIGNIIIKLFYRKRRLFSSDRIKPQAIRFCDNIQSLSANGYAVPKLIKIQYCSDLGIYLIYYHKIEGQDIRSLARGGNINIIHDAIKFIAHLHKNGVFFRSIHLENLLYTVDGKIALLDVSDLKIKSKSLTIYLRYRNLKHLFLQEPYDKEIWKNFGINQFLTLYFRSAELPAYSRRLLTYFINRAIF
jgi:serine/threonine protein kinase